MPQALDLLRQILLTRRTILLPPQRPILQPVLHQLPLQVDYVQQQSGNLSIQIIHIRFLQPI